MALRRTILIPPTRLAISVGAVVVLTASAPACFVENNPDFFASLTAADTSSGTTDATTSDGTGASTGTTGSAPCPIPGACEPIHIGPSPASCPHRVDGVETDACDLDGKFSLRVAVARAGLDGGARIFVHPGSAPPAVFAGDFDAFANTWISAAPGVRAQDIVIRCTSDAPANIRLLGDDSRLLRVSLVNGGDCRSGVAVRTDPATPGTETAGHLIEGVTMSAYRPAFMGTDPSGPPLVSLGPDTAVRNSYFRGYFAGGIDLRNATRAQIVGNTFGHFADYGQNLFDVDGVSELVIANNVFVALPRASPTVAAASASTTDLTVIGNFAEGFNAMVTGVDPADHAITDNAVGPVDLEAPSVPRFLADSPQRASPNVPMAGVSADGVSLGAVADPFPGAFQMPSERMLPRATAVRVGNTACGVNVCDLTAADDDEIQQAVWRAWPGSTVEVYPSPDPYAGSAIVTWPVHIVGTGATPTEATLQVGEQDTQLAALGLWQQHPAVVAVTRDMAAASSVDGLTVRAPAGEAAILIESSAPGQAPPAEHELRRLWIEDDGSGPVAQGLYLGDTTIATDVLVRGDVRTCIRYGVRATDDQPTPVTTSYVTNLSCRLQTAEPDVAALDVASADGSFFVNVVVDMDTPGPLLRAQRRSVGDRDPTALDAPTAFTIDATAARGFAPQLGNFFMADGTYVVTIDQLLPADPLFVSVTDSHLDPLAVSALDAGVDPSTLTPMLMPGVDLDGIDRTGRMIDRGCYEQGL